MTKESEGPTHVNQFTSPDGRTTTVTKNDFSGLPDGGTPLSPAEHRIDPFVIVEMQPSDNHALPEVVPAGDALDDNPYAIVELLGHRSFGAVVKKQRTAGVDMLTCLVLHPYKASGEPGSVVATYTVNPAQSLYGMMIVDEARARAYNSERVIELPTGSADFRRDSRRFHRDRDLSAHIGHRTQWGVFKKETPLDDTKSVNTAGDLVVVADDEQDAIRKRDALVEQGRFGLDDIDVRPCVVAWAYAVDGTSVYGCVDERSQHVAFSTDGDIPF